MQAGRLLRRRSRRLGCEFDRLDDLADPRQLDLVLVVEDHARGAVEGVLPAALTTTMGQRASTERSLRLDSWYSR